MKIKKSNILVISIAALVLFAFIILLAGNRTEIINIQVAKSMCLVFLGAAAGLNAVLNWKNKRGTAVVSILFTLTAFIVAVLNITL